ncbi:hypothetical protein, partial [Gluconacetobacter sacchari]|uniref:hypothetical protein n=1 Tax=Gluconacetobacter sacchari TaxID=92759 RepID=UPI00222E7488
QSQATRSRTAAPAVNSDLHPTPNTVNSRVQKKSKNFAARAKYPGKRPLLTISVPTDQGSLQRQRAIFYPRHLSCFYPATLSVRR